MKLKGLALDELSIGQQNGWRRESHQLATGAMLISHATGAPVISVKYLYSANGKALLE